ncbi:DUF4129 domain-containing protein [Haladaptatus sp. AB643]|uniref:DUF4129 domain-containing protein n=1 Tax=unclassified Haladaptatus TaxID=2622732 RepID=UPI00209BC553|nr:DUF4129 domain-containing protein [Haladaptatus sp. AB643]MCO8254578.1 DUF4129 domain-containing protein [Haladaptatus sp. AB618]
MERDTARVVVIALLCILAIAFAAATLNSAVEDGSGTGLGGGPGGIGSSQTNGSSPPMSNGGGKMGTPLRLPCYPVLDSTAAILAMIVAFLLLAALAYRKAGGLGVLAVVGPVGVPFLFIHALLTACVTPDGGGILGGAINTSDISLPKGGTGGLGNGANGMATPSLIMFVVLGVALLGAVVLLVRSSSGNEDTGPDAGNVEENQPDIAAVGRAAGEAADRIESESGVENEVYRAWREMTEYLNVPSPHSSTPGEFASAAVAAGMDPEDVDELTSVFEEVRYGGYDASEDHERRAIDALRRIERAYADDEEGGE